VDGDATMRALLFMINAAEDESAASQALEHTHSE